MTRFVLLLLAFIMPLQMSWAAVHFCDEAAAVPEASHAAPGHLHGALAAEVGTAAEHATTAGTGQPADVDCCGCVAHGCHGLHNLMASGSSGLTIAAGPDRLSQRPAHAKWRLFSTRIERPQWSAA